MAGQSNYETRIGAKEKDLGGYIELTNTPSRIMASSGGIHEPQQALILAFSPPKISLRKIPNSELMLILSYLSVPKVHLWNSSYWLDPSTIKSLSALRGTNLWAERIIETFLKAQTQLQQPVPHWNIGTTKRSLLDFLDKKLSNKVYENTRFEEALNERFLSRKLMAICLLGTLALPSGIALCVVGAEKDSKIKFIIPGIVLLALCLFPAWMLAVCCSICCEDSPDGETTCADNEDVDPLPCINRKLCCPKPKIYNPSVSEINFSSRDRERLKNTVTLFRDLLGDRHLSPEEDFQAGMARLLQADKCKIRDLQKGQSIADTSAIVFQGAGAAAGSTLETPLMQDFEV
jgi:hypothetical protein